MSAAKQERTTSATNLPQEKFDELHGYIESLETQEGALIHVLHRAQEIFTYLPLEVQLYIARQLDLPAAEVFGVVSFYSYFTTKPVGKHTISVCMGTACFVRGSEAVFKAFKEELGIQPGEISPDGLFSIKDVRCIGACGLAPVVTVGEKVYGHVKPEDVKTILDEYRADQVLEDLN